MGVYVKTQRRATTATSDGGDVVPSGELEARRRKAGLSVAAIASTLNRPYKRVWGLLHGGFQRVDEKEIRALEAVIEREERANEHHHHGTR